MRPNIRVTPATYEALRDIKLALETKHRAAAPSLQNIADAAFEKFLDDWQDPEMQAKLTNDLLERRKATRQRQGPHAKLPESNSQQE